KIYSQSSTANNQIIKITKTNQQGTLLTEHHIVFDYSDKAPQHTFISHAHSDHMPRSRKSKVFCTANTQKLMHKRGFSGTASTLEFGQPLETDRARITLYPAGPDLGSAKDFVDSDEGSVLY